MKAVVQRVSYARVFVGGEAIGECGSGLLVLAAAKKGDSFESARKLADRVYGLRLFNDAAGKINLSVTDACPGEANNLLAISNFTIYGETSKNRRPSFAEAAGFDEGLQLFDEFCDELSRLGARVARGIFGADMQIEILNDGPVTVIVET